MIDDPDFIPLVGDLVTLDDEPGAIIPPGDYTVSSVNPDGSFHVGGNTAVWPCRIVARVHYFKD